MARLRRALAEWRLETTSSLNDFDPSTFVQLTLAVIVHFQTR